MHNLAQMTKLMHRLAVADAATLQHVTEAQRLQQEVLTTHSSLAAMQTRTHAIQRERLSHEALHSRQATSYQADVAWEALLRRECQGNLGRRIAASNRTTARWLVEAEEGARRAVSCEADASWEMLLRHVREAVCLHLEAQQAVMAAAHAAAQERAAGLERALARHKSPECDPGTMAKLQALEATVVELRRERQALLAVAHGREGGSSGRLSRPRGWSSTTRTGEVSRYDVAVDAAPGSALDPDLSSILNPSPQSKSKPSPDPSPILTSIVTATHNSSPKSSSNPTAIDAGCHSDRPHEPNLNLSPNPPDLIPHPQPPGHAIRPTVNAAFDCSADVRTVFHSPNVSLSASLVADGLSALDSPRTGSAPIPAATTLSPTTCPIGNHDHVPGPRIRQPNPVPHVASFLASDVTHSFEPAAHRSQAALLRLQSLSVLTDHLLSDA